MNKKRIILIAVAAVIIVGGGVWLFGGAKAKHKVTYATATIHKGEISESVTATGTIEPGIPPQSGTGIVISTQCLYQSGILLGILRLQSAGKVQTANHCLSIYTPVFTVIKAHGE